MERCFSDDMQKNLVSSREHFPAETLIKPVVWGNRPGDLILSSAGSVQVRGGLKMAFAPPGFRPLPGKPMKPFGKHPFNWFDNQST